MTKQERNRIQKWIEDTELEIKCLQDVKRYYKDDPELKAYFEGQEDAYKEVLETFEFYLNEWKICKSE